MNNTWLEETINGEEELHIKIFVNKFTRYTRTILTEEEA